MKNLFLLTIITVICSCAENNAGEEARVKIKTPTFSSSEANNLADLPFSCIQTEYPNKLGQVIGSDSDLGSPKELHPAFYGCFDWHSAVHGHWSAVKLLKDFPELEKASELKHKLTENLTQENIMKEVEYFNGEFSNSYERTYGWAWLLKLSEELYTWEDSLGSELHSNLEPLTELIVKRYMEFLPKLVYPIRVGEHTNTAFGLSFALDYSRTCGKTKLENTIISRAKEFYMKDCECPISWEPSGYDFLSPCLEELGLMSKVLPKEEFLTWQSTFLPQLSNSDFHITPGKIMDRTDGKLVHLDGLNFSRAWIFYALQRNFTEFKHLENLGHEHMNYSYSNLVGDSYEGGHWLGSFALYALAQNNSLIK